MSDRYVITKLLGKGRISEVYEAQDAVLQRTVALRRFYSVKGEPDDTSWTDRFMNLTGKLASLSHPNLATVYNADIGKKGPYLTTEFLPYPTLEHRLESGRLELEEFWALATDVLEALAVPHSQGFSHAGLTMKSIILQPRSRGDVKYRIIDLGLAWLIPLINPDNSIRSLSDPAIMAPELFDDQQPTPQTDVYMLGMLLYQALAGGHPLAGLPSDQAYQKHLQHSFAPVTGYRTSVPPEISDWLEILTQADPTSRPSSAIEALNLLPAMENIDPLYFQAADQTTQTTQTPTATNPLNTTQPLASIEPESSMDLTNPTSKFSAKLITALAAGAAVLAMIILLVVK